MRRFRSRILTLVGVLVAVAVLPAASAGVSGELRQHLRDAVDARGFSGTVLFARGGEVRFHEAYGMADRARGVRNSTATLYDIGSISKQFTKAAVLVLARDGSLALGDPIGEHLDGVPADKAGITIEQVIDHRAGLHEYHDTDGDFEPLDRAEALRRILGQRLRFEPGSDRAYSNSGYTLLAALVEHVSGKPFRDFVRERLLAPAGMERTGWYRDPRWKKNEQVATGYDARTFGEQNSPAHWPEPSWALLGNGGMVSNPAELLRWIRAVNDDPIFDAATRAAFYRLDLAGDGPEPPKMVAYAGANDFGFVAVVVEHLRDDGCLIVTTNADGATNAEKEIRALAQIAMPDLEFGPRRRSSETGGGTPPPPAGGWGLPGSPTGKVASAMLDAIADGSAEAAERFVRERFHPEWYEQHTLEELVGVFRQVQTTMADPRLEAALKRGPGEADLLVRSGTTGEAVRIRMTIEPREPHRIVGLDVSPEDE